MSDSEIEILRRVIKEQKEMLAICLMFLDSENRTPEQRAKIIVLLEEMGVKKNDFRL